VTLENHGTKKLVTVTKTRGRYTDSQCYLP